MAKFFNKNYKHAYERHNKVWVRGTVDNHPHKRISTGKEFNKANMNWAEKHWRDELRRHFDGKRLVEVDNNMPTLDEYALESFEQNRLSNRPTTTERYREKYTLHISYLLGSYKLNNIRAGDIKKLHNSLIEKELSFGYASSINIILSGILRNAIEDELIDKNVVKSIRFPKEDRFKQQEREDNPFSLDEVLLLIEKAEGQFKTILTFQFFTGARPSEMIALQWDDVDFKNKTVTISKTRQASTDPITHKKEITSTKTGKSRKIDMLDIVATALHKQYEETGNKSEFVFLNTLQKIPTPYMSIDGLRKRQWKNLLTKVGLKQRKFSITRHTFASIFLSKGEEPEWVGLKMLGHSSMTITNKYYRKYIEQVDRKRGTFLNDYVEKVS